MNSNINKTATALSAIVFASVFFLAALQLKVDQTYSEFIVGSLAWHAGNKLQDLVVWPIFILSSFLAFSVLSKICTKLHSNHGSDVSTGFATQLILWSVPFYAGIANLFLGGEIDKKTAAVSALGIVSLAAIGFFKRNSPGKADPRLWSATLLLALLTSLIPIEIAVLLSRAPIDLVGELNLKRFVLIGNALAVLGFALGVLALTRSERNIERHLPRIALIAQIGLPLFFLTLYPSRLLQESGQMTAYETTVYLRILIFALVAYGVYDVIKRFFSNDAASDWRNYFSPIALFSLIVALKTGHTSVPNLSSDDYHFGEHVIGWWSYLKGFVPYVDYIPPHGLLENDFVSMLSYVFYDGTAASAGEARRLAIALVGLIAFLSIYRFTGSLILAFSLSLLLGGRLTWFLGERLIWFFFVPFICMWLSHQLRAQPSKWLIVWMISAPVVVLSVPPQGLLLVAAFGVLAVKMSWDQAWFGDKRSWRNLIAVAIAVCLLVAVTPIFLMLLGAIRYVLENGPINQIAYGVPWALSSNAGAKSGFVFEAIRMSWVATPLLCLYLMAKHWRELKDSGSLFYPALIFFLFSLLLIPYSMGRIDPDGVSRPGFVSIFAWSVLLPLLLWGFSKYQTRALIVLSAVFMSAIIGFGVTPFSRLSTVAAQHIASPTLRDSAAAGLPNIGRAYMEETHWDRINRLNTLLRLRLSDRETYLDLSSRNAHYFYLNRMPAMPVTAPYNLTPPAQQKRAVDAIKASPPKLALLQADNIVHDGGGLALRNPYLYRFVMDHYAPRMENGFIVGYLKTHDKNIAHSDIVAEIKNITDENWLHGVGRREPAIVLSDPILTEILKVGGQILLADGSSRSIERISAKEAAIWLSGEIISAPETTSGNFIRAIVPPEAHREYVASLFQRSFAVSDFQKIPVSWGRSAKSLSKKMTSPISLAGLSPTTSQVLLQEGSYKVEGNDPQLVFDLSKLGVTGRNAGLLKFDFTCLDETAEPRMQVFWWGDHRNGPHEALSVRFTANNGTLIVPLDASPWWTGLGHVKGMRIDLDNPSACRAFDVENIALYRRK